MNTIDYAKLGIEAEAFLRSSLGKYMMSRIDEIIEQGKTDLVLCDPHNVQMNIDIRNDIKVCQMFKEFIDATIADGLNAAEQLNTEDIS